jgi:hypothetical protein
VCSYRATDIGGRHGKEAETNDTQEKDKEAQQKAQSLDAKRFCTPGLRIG